METSSLGRNSSVPLPDGIPQWQSFTGTQCPSCSSCPSRHRQPENINNIKCWHFSSVAFFGLSQLKVKLYLNDKILADTAHVPINQHSCGDIDWHSCLGRSDPLVLHSAHLGWKENQSCSSLKEKNKWKSKILLCFFPQLQQFTVTIHLKWPIQ